MFDSEDEFQEWVDKIEMETDEVMELLSNPLSDEPMALIGDLREIEAWNARMGHILAEANTWLEKCRLWYMPSREGKTEAERKVTLDSEVSPMRQCRDSVEFICDAIRQRLILGESMLSYFKNQYADRT